MSSGVLASWFKELLCSIWHCELCSTNPKLHSNFIDV